MNRMTTETHTSSPEDRFEPVSGSRTFNRILDALGLRNKKVLDLGCGYGEYLVKFGPGSVGVTSTPDEVAFAKRQGISVLRGNVELIDELPLERDFEGIWANNLFEHLLSPHAFLMRLKFLAGDDSLLVLGVPVVPRIALLMRISKFRGALAVAHVNFFTRETLRLTVERAGWKVGELRPFIFSNRMLDTAASFFAPHLYVVARNDVSFAYHEKKLKEWKGEPLYAALLRIARARI